MIQVHMLQIIASTGVFWFYQNIQYVAQYTKRSIKNNLTPWLNISGVSCRNIYTHLPIKNALKRLSSPKAIYHSFDNTNILLWMPHKLITGSGWQSVSQCWTHRVKGQHSKSLKVIFDFCNTFLASSLTHRHTPDYHPPRVHVVHCTLILIWGHNGKNQQKVHPGTELWTDGWICA